MKIRYQILEGGMIKTLDTVLESRNKYSAMKTLLETYGVKYNPSRIKERCGWLEVYYLGDLYRVSSQFG